MFCFFSHCACFRSEKSGEKEVSRYAQKYESGEFEPFLKSVHEQYLAQKEEKLKEINDSIAEFSKDLSADPIEKEVVEHVHRREQELKKIASQFPDYEISKAIKAVFSDEDHEVQRYFYALKTRSKTELTPLELKLQELQQEYFNKDLLVSMDYITGKIDLKNSLELHFALEKEQIDKMSKISAPFDEPTIKKKLELYRDSFLKRSAQKIDVNYLRELEKGTISPSNKAEEKAKEILKSSRDEMNKLLETAKKTTAAK